MIRIDMDMDMDMNMKMKMNQIMKELMIGCLLYNRDHDKKSGGHHHDFSALGWIEFCRYHCIALLEFEYQYCLLVWYSITVA